MKEQTNQYYQECINTVQKYIEDNLSHSLYLEDIARTAHISSFHFHRIFKSLTGYSLKNYVIRLRLEKAATQLINSSKDISSIAFENGFQSLENFSRSFSSHFGMSPTVYREEQKDLVKEKHAFYTNENHAIKTGLSDPEFKTMEPLKLAYIRHTGPYANVGETWKRLIKWGYKKWLLGFSVKTIGIVHDNPEITEEEDIRYDACIVIKKEIPPEGEIGFRIIDGGKYVVFQYQGPYHELNTAYDWIYAVWLRTNDVELADKPCFEWYQNSPQKVKPENLITDIYIPLI